MLETCTSAPHPAQRLLEETDSRGTKAVLHRIAEARPWVQDIGFRI